MSAEFDEELAQARAGDREAMDRILARNQERFERVAQARIGPGLRTRVRASDVLQSTYYDAWRSVGDFEGDGEDAFVAWVTRIMENNIRDKGKYFGAQKRREPDVAPDDFPGMARQAVPSPSVQAVRAEDLDGVHRALQELPEDYREIIRLRMVEGKSHREAGEILGRSEAAIRMLYSRARAALALAVDRQRQGPESE